MKNFLKQNIQMRLWLTICNISEFSEIRKEKRKRGEFNCQVGKILEIFAEMDGE